MSEHDVRWNEYPKVAEDPTARGWLTMQAGRNLAKHTIETYGRSMEDFLRFTVREGSGRSRPRASIWPRTCANCWRARIRASRRSCISTLAPDYPMRRCCCDCRSSACSTTISCSKAFGRRILSARMHWRRRYGRWPGDCAAGAATPEAAVDPDRRAVASDSGGDAAGVASESRDVCTVVRRGAASPGDCPRGHWRYRSRASTGARPAENAKNGCERVVPYAEPTARLLAAYLDCGGRSVRSRTAVRLLFAPQSGPPDQCVGVVKNDHERGARVGCRSIHDPYAAAPVSDRSGARGMGHSRDRGVCRASLARQYAAVHPRQRPRTVVQAGDDHDSLACLARAAARGGAVMTRLRRRLPRNASPRGAGRWTWPPTIARPR